MSKNYLVTGGAGFIGSHVVDLLLKNKKSVTVVDNLCTGRKKNIQLKNKKLKFVNCNIQNYSKRLESIFKNIDVVIHLAALADIVPSINHPEEYFQTNVNGTLNVLKASQENNIKKFVYAASASCYGIPDKFPTDENTKIKLEYPYALTKKMGEDLVLHWSKVYKLNVTSLRLFNVYGTRSRTSGAYGAVFGVFLAQKINNKPLTVVGDGKQTRDFIYVSDVAKAFYKASKYKKSGDIINIGSGKETTVDFIANFISKNNKIYLPKRPGEPDRSRANIIKAYKLLNWKPTIKIANGIQMLLDNINYWKNAPVWNKTKISKATKVWFKFLK
ncbi:UDP-glucose 4-epimerase [alpha proteobacterium HIMB114]|nr:UDP-glucose 4-epimerase [alpha proteobacterium HIMB114]